MTESFNKDCAIKQLQDIKPVANIPKRILFIKSSSLGDIFHALPAFYLLSAACPGCKIDWLVNTNFAPVLEYVKKDLNNLIYFDREAIRTAGALKGIVKLIKSIRKERYDLVIDVQGLIRSSLMTFVARAGRKAGFAVPREKLSTLFYNQKIKIPEELQHAIEKNTFLVSKILNMQHIVPDYVVPPVEKYKNGALKVLKENNVDPTGYIAFAPGTRWVTKCWPTQFFAAVADAINTVYPKLNIVLVGAASDNEIADEIISKCKVSKPVSLTGKSNLCVLVEVLRGAGVLLTNDSGPMHIAASLRVPVFALFGPTAPGKTGPFWQWHKIYQNDKGCIKCFKRECKKETLECQQYILPEKVAADIVNKYKTLKPPVSHSSQSGSG